MTQKYSVPRGTRILRGFLKLIARGILKIISQIDIQGLENIPREGPYVVVFNHVSIYDPLFLLAFWPTTPEIVGATEVWNRPGQDILAKLWHAIPIRRGDVDRSAMEKILSVLRSGQILMLAPEGTRSHHPGMQNAKPGVVYIIEATGSKVIPVGVTGTTSDFFKQVFKGKRPKVTLNIGESFDISEFSTTGLPPKEIRQRKADDIMRKIARLLPVEYHGVYSESAQ